MKYLQCYGFLKFYPNFNLRKITFNFCKIVNPIYYTLYNHLFIYAKNLIDV